MADLSAVVAPEGAPRLRDFVLGAALGVALSAGLMEIPRVSDSVTAAMDLSTQGQALVEGCRPIDRVYGATIFVQSQAQLEAGLYEGNLKLSDAATPALWLAVSLQESCRPRDPLYGAAIYVPAAGLSAGLAEYTVHGDEFGQADLYGLGAWVKVSDSVTASVGSDLFASGFDETLHAQDGSAGSTQTLDPEQTSSPAESLKIADSVLGPTLNPEQTSGFDELLHIQDSVLGPTLDPERTSGFDELLHVQDAVTASMGGLSASGFDELLHVQDGSAGSAQLLNPEQAAPSESLKIADTTTPTLNPFFASGFDELLHVQDTVTGPTLDPERASGFDELLHVQDGSVGSAQLLNPEQASPSEGLKVSDSVSATLDPLQTSGFDEAAKVSDGGFVEISHDETVRIFDTASAGLTPLFASGFDELLHCQDQAPSVSLGSGASLTESLKIADSVTAQTDQLYASGFDEALHCQDSVANRFLTPLLASGFDELLHMDDVEPPGTLLNPEGTGGFDESLHVQDAVTASLGGLFVAAGPESCRLADVATATMDPEQAAPSEAAKVADQAAAVLSPLLASGFDEAGRLADSAAGGLTPLLVAAGPEALKIGDQASSSQGGRFLKPAVPLVTRAFDVVRLLNDD